MMAKGNLLLVAASLVLALVVGEVVLRLLGISYPEINRLDPVLGWSPRPGLAGAYALEGRTHIRINDAGFRDEAHALAKPPGTLRVAVLGDSFTEGREVALEDTFWKVAERKLSDCVGAVEVLGFGVNGYGTAQAAIALETRVWPYSPDVVMLAFFTGNDVANNSRALDGHPDRPYFVLRDGALVVDDGNLRSARFRTKKTWSDLKHALHNASRTLQVARQAYRRVRGGSAAGGDVLDQLGAGLGAELYREPTGPWREAWRVSEALIAHMRDAAAARDADFWLVTLTNPIQVYPDASVRDTRRRALGVESLDYPDRRLAEFAAVRGIPAITLVETLRHYAEANAARLHGSKSFAGGHWNARGHRVAGEVMAARLCAAYGEWGGS